MKLRPQLVPGWPKLAWVATFAEGSPDIHVLHGPRVEVADDWVAEAVWAGDFEGGDFDRTDLVFGSGIRLRGDRVVFCTSGSAVDCLWWVHRDRHWGVSNTLPGILARTRLSLRGDYDGYPQDVESIDEHREGIGGYVRQFVTSGEPVSRVFFANLIFDGETLVEEEKPDTAGTLQSYGQYEAYLFDTARRLGSNLAANGRTHAIVPVTTISTGYDSCAVAVIAREAGCRHAVTIRNSTSLWRGSDSGEAVARRLGMNVRVYEHRQGAYRQEEYIWAAIGRPKGLNMTVFEYPKPLALFFTGNYGDKIWDLAYKDVSMPSGDLSGLCLCEFRLAEGFFHVLPAWWGVRHSLEIRAINRSEEMAPWRTNDGYDRPIARRIIEEAGIPRGSFAVHKKNVSSDAPFWWPYATTAQESFARFLRERRPEHLRPGSRTVWLIRRAAHLENLLYKNLLRPLGVRRRLRPWHDYSNSPMLFVWANTVLTGRYEAGVDRSRARAIA